MLRAVVLLSSSFLFSTASAAQSEQEITLGANARAFHGNMPETIKTFQSDRDANDIVQGIVHSIGLPSRFEVRSGNVPNASAILTRDNKRLIVYNPQFMANIVKRTADAWSLTSILAHEIGHHLAFHMSEQIEDYAAELEADYFSGFVLGKEGATLDQSLLVMRTIASPEGSPSHPGLDDRLRSISLGWQSAKANRVPDPVITRTVSEKSNVEAAGSGDLQILSLTVDESRSSFLIDQSKQSIHARLDDKVRPSIEYDQLMGDVFRTAGCRGIHGEEPIEDALPVWRSLLEARGQTKIAVQLKDYAGYRSLVAADSAFYEARPTAAELADLRATKPDYFALIMRWMVNCVGVPEPVLIWTLKNDSPKPLVLAWVDYEVLDVGEVKGAGPGTVEPIDIAPHDLAHKIGTQKQTISPQILLNPGDVVAIRIRYRLEQGAGFTWLVKPVFHTLEGPSAEGPEFKLFAAKR